MKNSTRRSLTRCVRIGAGLLSALTISASIALVDLGAQSGQVPIPIPGRNINMVSGTNFPGGDPFLQRQNEPSIAVSTRNPLHLLGSANDYRTVDIPGLGDGVNGDAWISVFKSFDGGSTWKSTLLPGFRQDVTPEGRSSPLYGLQAGADPVIRAGTNGLFYLGAMAFNRDQDAGKVFVARYIDNNNLEAGDSIAYLSTTVVDVGSEDRFLDKPWIAVDIPRAMKGQGRTDADDRNDRSKLKDKRDKDFDPNKPNPATNKGLPKKPTTGPVCQVPGQAQPIPAGNIYVIYSAFLEPLAQDPNKPRRKGKELEGLGKHRQGVPMEGRTKIMLSRSTDCGATFSRPQQISERSQINQAAVAAIDPNTGTLYVAWREFLSNAQPDAILITRSSDGGKSFSSPITVATIRPFDQGTTPTSFRTNSYPAMTVDATGRVYVAWAQRGVGPGGDARIVVATSPDGRTWSQPIAADNPPQRGHQIMPVLNFGGAKLHLVYWDQRDDVSKMWGEYIDDFIAVNWTGPSAQRPKRHTLDLRAAAGWPGAPPTWGPSAKVSNYLEGVRAGRTAPEQLQFNPPNLPLFSVGTKPFIGDYLDVTMSPSFLSNGDGTWRFNTLPSDPATFFTAWGDNRDVRAPRDGNWVRYTAPTFAGYTGTSIFDPTQPVAVCEPGQAGMRDQNVYSARVSTGLIMSTLGNNKPLGFVTDADGVRRLLQRSFVITVTNPESVVKSVVLHITAQPPGGRASFLQFAQLLDLPVDIAAGSSISREVFVTSTDPRAAVPITVTEGSSANAAGRVYLNPDPTNPDIDNPDIDNPDIDNPDIDNAEAHAITVSNAVVSNPDIDNTTRANPDIDNPDIDNPDIDNSLLANPSIINPDIDNPDIDNPNIINPDIDNPDIDNPDIDNAALTDVTWNVSNVGNTATAYQIKLLLKQAQQQRLLNAGVQFQLVITKTTAAPAISRCAVVEPNRNLTVVNINSPSFVDPSSAQQVSTVINPDIENPDIDNATMALAPGDTARVTLRIYSPLGDTSIGDGAPAGNPLADLAGALADLRNLGVATTSYPVDTADVVAGETTPQIDASIPLIVTETLDDATRGLAYSEVIEQRGSTAPFAFALTTGSLPPGLTLAANGAITGTPTLSGAFTFTVTLSAANDMTATATLTIRVFEPVVVLGGPLPGASVNQAAATTLSATGGFAPYSWSLAAGALPTGVSLSAAGVVSGTPTQSGTFGFTAMATDVASPTRFATGAFQLSVAAGATAQTVNVVEDTATPITLGATGGGPFTFVIGNPPAHGTLTGSGPTFSYTPTLNYNGPDSFTFRVTQGEITSGFATVSINVTPVNDAAAATPMTVNTPQGVALPILLAGSDAENNPLTFSILTGPTDGTLSGTAPNLTYTPPAGFNGNATFSFRAHDGTVFSPSATVTVIVGPPPAGSADVTLALTDTPDPVALGGSIAYSATIHNNGPATATGVSFTLAYPASELLLQSVTPAQGACTAANPIVCTIGSIAPGGDVPVAVVLRSFNRGGSVIVNGAVSATPLDYNTSNNSVAQTTTITGPPTATSDLSVSQSRAPAVVPYGGNVVYTVVVTNNGPSDANGISLFNTFTPATATFVSSTSSQGACSASGSQVSCTVGALINGASASYTITLQARGSGSLSNTASVIGSQSDPAAANNSSTVATPIENRAPTAINDVAATNEDMATAIAVLGNDNDPDGDALSITGITTPLHGVAQLAGNSISYTPTGDYNGPDSFTYTISDGAGGTANGTVLVSVLSVNDAPNFVAGPNQAIGLGAGPQTVDNWATAIRAGPAGETGQALNFIVSNSNRDLFSSQPAIAPNGTLSYALALGGQGSATVTVVLQDDGDTANGGVDSTTPRAFTIATNISVANVAPSFAAGPNVSTNEDAGAFVPVNNEGGQRSRHTATRLTDGRVLIAGGSADLGTLVGAELYDPATRVQQLTGSMNVARVSHTATRLLNGLVLIVGGSSGAVVLDSAELFNPATGQFTPAAGTLAGGRLGHTATLLPNGRVLVAGGSGPDLEPLNSAEIFDPVTNTFSPTGALGMPRTTHSAARLADGRVLVVAGYTAGGLTTATAEIFDHNTGLFAITGSLTRARGGETATTLPNHLVLVAGGADETSFVLSSELYNPATGEFTPGPNLIAGRYGYDAELLSDGTVLLAGGRTGSAVSDPAQYSASAEIYNPATNSFSPTGGLATARTDFELTALSDGSVLASGGFNADLIVGATELYVSPAPQLVPGWATAISAGQASESGQLLDFIVTNDNNALFSEQPAIDPTGELSFRSVANASGSATVTLRLHDDGGVADGGVDTSAPQTFVINIASVNDAPNFGKGPDQSLLEDAGPQFVPEWATGMVVGPGNELGQGLDFVVSTDNPGLFAGVPAIDADTGTLTFTPAANANGSAVVSVHLRDTGGTANGGVNVSSLETFVVTVAPVNDSPRFNPLPGLYQVPANAGPQTVPGWVTGISAGPANENAQSVVLLVTNENNTFFSTQPVISADGTLSFTAAPGATGGATVTVRARDDGGTANGGNDTSLPQDFMIAIGESQNADLAVTQTDAPDAAPSGDNYTYTIRIENLGPGTATGVVLTEDISENLTFVGIVGDGSCVIGPITRFTCQTSAIDSGGIRTLVATVSGPFGTAQSVATVTANEADPNPANNTSTEQTTIDTYPVAVNDNVATASGVAINIDVLGNDTDPDVAAGDALRILAVGGAEHGTVSHVSGTGVLKYTPVPGYTGIDTFSYTVADSITLTSVGLVTVLVTQAVCVAEPADLISWWPGESDATDVRGANNGAAFDRVTFAAGMVGQAFALDGSPGVGILVPASPSLNPSAVTLAAWVRPASNAVQSVIGKAGSFALGVNNLAQATCSVGDFINLAGGSVQVNEWSHVACTSDGITARLYVGGVQVAQAADDAGIPTNDSSLVIGGGDPANPGGEFGGLIDEAMIFGRALSQGEIASIVGAGDAGVCLDRPLVAVADMIATATDTPFTFSPSANDRDPDLPAPAVVATVPLVAAGTPMLTSPGDVAIVESTGLAYFSGGLVSVAAPGAIGILDTTTNTIVGSMAMPVKSAQTLSRVNQTTNIAYFRGSALTAVDGRPGSPTFNQVILSLQLGNIQSMAIDEVRGRLYVTSITNATTSSPFHSRIMLVDVDPSSPTFHQVIDQGPAPGGGSALGVGVNTVSDKVYIAVSGGSASGVYVYDGATLNETLVASTAGAQTVVVNDAANLIYAATGTSLFVIDGASDTRLALITLPASGSLGHTRYANRRSQGDWQGLCSSVRVPESEPARCDRWQPDQSDLQHHPDVHCPWSRGQRDGGRRRDRQPSRCDVESRSRDGGDRCHHEQRYRDHSLYPIDHARHHRSCPPSRVCHRRHRCAPGDRPGQRQPPRKLARWQ